MQGLRTLVVGERTVPEEEWRAWNEKYQAAASLLDNREHQLSQVLIFFRDERLLSCKAVLLCWNDNCQVAAALPDIRDRQLA